MTVGVPSKKAVTNYWMLVGIGMVAMAAWTAIWAATSKE